jgi:hypothetical protein
MGLKGAYNFKGIELSDAYLQIGTISCNFSSTKSTSIKTPAVYNADGTIKNEEVLETNWVKKNNNSCYVHVFKDKAAREENPNNSISTFAFDFEVSLADSAKNHIKQAYVALKADDKYKDYTDV